MMQAEPGAICSDKAEPCLNVIYVIYVSRVSRLHDCTTARLQNCRTAEPQNNIFPNFILRVKNELPMTKQFLLIGVILLTAGINSDWELKKKSGGIEIYTRSIKGSTFDEFKGITVLRDVTLNRGTECYPGCGEL